MNWVEDYLQNRSQFVEINGEKSQWLPVKSGIPQGSVLGPLLFLIYINDLPENVNSTVYMYADDTKIYREIQSDDDHEVLQRDLETLKTWSKRWLLKFHPSKCYCINSLESTVDSPPLLPPRLRATRVDTIIHNYRLSAAP